MISPNEGTGAEFEFQRPDPTQVAAFNALAEDTHGFAAWWAEEGIGMPKVPWHNCEEHAHKVALFAYRAGMKAQEGGAA